MADNFNLPLPLDVVNPASTGAPVHKSVIAARYVQDPSQVLLPMCTGDPFLIVTRPPNSSVIFRRAVPASLTSTQLDFFGIGGANRDYMSVCNNANSPLLVHLGFDPASATNFTERVEPGKTYRLALSWIMYGGPVQGIWLPPSAAVSPVKYLPVNAALPINVLIPPVLGKKIRVLSYVLTAKDEVQATWAGLATPLSGPLQLKLSTLAVTGSMDAPLFETLPGEPLTLLLDVLKLVTGHIAYVEVADGTLTGDAQVIELL